MAVKEACVESIEQCLQAQGQGATRIELCANLDEDGLTPSSELIQEAISQLNIPIRVMIRPRPGNFVYTEEELSTMIESIQHCHEQGVEGVVFGVCDTDNTLDIPAIRALAAHASPLKVTVHKAIDACDNPVQELKKLKLLKGIDSVLTSGKQEKASEAKPLLKELIAVAGDDIEIVVCGKVTDQNIEELHQELNARAYHGKKIVGELDGQQTNAIDQTESV